MMATMLLFILLCVVVVQLVESVQVKRHIDIINDCGSRVQVYWVHPQTKDLSIMSTPDVMFGATFPLDSFVSHDFEVHELPNQKSGLCLNGSKPTLKGGGVDVLYCSKAHFTVNDNHDQQLKIVASGEEEGGGITIEHVDDKTIARDKAKSLISDCKQKALDQYEKEQLLNLVNEDKGAASSNGSEKLLESLASCVQNSVSDAMIEAAEESSFQERIRRNMGKLYENYTCADDKLETSDEVDTSTWIDPKNRRGGRYHIDILHKQSSSNIHLIEDFITDEECQAVEDQAESKGLEKAVVANYDGSELLSDHRRAMQAGIQVPWDKPKHPITVLSQRVYDYANHVLNLNIDHDGQEDLMSIQYFGLDIKNKEKNEKEETDDNNEKEEDPDQYLPHCDGDCSGDLHRNGNRVATMVMYCTIPQKGGATNFRNGGIHVKPAKNNAIFFSYIDPITKIMDNGYTEHSGCPVIEGTKRIVTQWIRLGVSTENPWDSYNSLGIKKEDN